MSAVLQTVPLGTQWPTLDPFLFCVHHHDSYPVGNSEFGPAAPLDGRSLGSDFDGIDGWRMYHGQVVPGFPSHPHRGFETVTYVRRGIVDHADSLGAKARYGRGDVQWLTAGGGIQHAEMFPLLDRDGPNPLELFQIWLNLPAVDKLVEPHFTMFWDRDIPKFEVDGVAVTTIAGTFGQATSVAPPSPPPASWASRVDADVAIWHLVVASDGTITLPPSRNEQTNRVLYVFAGSVAIDDVEVSAPTGVVVDSSSAVSVAGVGGSNVAAEVLMLQGRPIGEPVAQYGPFVMTTRAEIQQAFDDYQRTQFGGWPWDRHDPVHGAGSDRFAVHPDGRRES